MGKMLERMSEVIGHTYVDLDGRFNTVRTRESNLANLLCDCVRNAAGVDVVLINGGREGLQVWGAGGKGIWGEEGGRDMGFVEEGQQGMEKEGDRLEGGVARVGVGGRRGCEGGRRGRRGGKGRGEGTRGGKGWRGGSGGAGGKGGKGGTGIGGERRGKTAEGEGGELEVGQQGGAGGASNGLQGTRGKVLEPLVLAPPPLPPS